MQPISIVFMVVLHPWTGKYANQVGPKKRFKNIPFGNDSALDTPATGILTGFQMARLDESHRITKKNMRADHRCANRHLLIFINLCVQNNERNP